jgi:DNA polymerase-3 subunit epsilon
MPDYAWLFEAYEGDEAVSIDCETTGLDVAKAEILSVGAIRIKGRRIETSRRLELVVRPSGGFSDELVKLHHLRPVDVERGLPPEEALRRVLDFIGPRPLVGYYLKFDVAMLNKYVRPMLGVPLPNRQIEVSSLYYEWRAAQLPAGANIDLRFETIRAGLDLPRRAEHDAFNDALLAAMMYLRLEGDWMPKALRRR